MTLDSCVRMVQTATSALNALRGKAQTVNLVAEGRQNAG